MKAKLSLSALAILITAITLGRSGFRGPASVDFDSADPINHAVSVFITKRGQQYFSRNLEDVLFRNGFSINEGAFPGLRFEADRPLRLSELSPRMQPHAQTLLGIRDTLKRWMMGFQFNDPRIKASVKNISYKMNFSRFGVRTDLAGARTRGLESGLLLVLEIESPRIRVNVARTRVSDLNNDFLGEFGIDDFFMKNAAASIPLKVSMPFLINTDANGKVSMRALSMRTNITALTLELGFKRPLILPRVEIRVNDRVMVLNQEALENDLIAKQQELFKAFQTYIKEATESQVLDGINGLLAQAFEKRIAETNQMDPVGLDRPMPEDRLKWGIHPEFVKMHAEHVELGFAGFIEDPRAGRTAMLPHSARANAKANLRGYAVTDYDMAIAINQGVLNRMMQLSFERGYFKEYKTAGGDSVELLAPPEFHFDQTTDGKVAKLITKYRSHASGIIENIVLRGGVDIESEMIFRAEMHPTKGPRLKILQVDPNTVKIDRQDIRFLPGRVRSSVMSSIAKSNEAYARNDESLNGAIPIPPSIFGVPVKIKDLRVETTGNLILYVEYGVRDAIR